MEEKEVGDWLGALTQAVNNHPPRIAAYMQGSHHRLWPVENLTAKAPNPICDRECIKIRKTLSLPRPLKRPSLLQCSAQSRNDKCYVLPRMESPQSFKRGLVK
ncbi:hypothetical protein M378DRAFT_949025 [Amanita muscaria Koide BX008]|uniref:Uncharacterized protein n=1 Tax=Amanita muscaria (strain Koide BX008) TaxID=946122 RepID=A0A0C2WFR0_AMAMK|nr:hypothetical protein M378DRAFT_949025 [Amanita muscaria Koide BX008]